MFHNRDFHDNGRLPRSSPKKMEEIYKNAESFPILHNYKSDDLIKLMKEEKAGDIGNLLFFSNNKMLIGDPNGGHLGFLNIIFDCNKLDIDSYVNSGNFFAGKVMKTNDGCIIITNRTGTYNEQNMDFEKIVELSDRFKDFFRCRNVILFDEKSKKTDKEFLNEKSNNKVNKEFHIQQDMPESNV